MSHRYPVRFEPADEGGYVITFPDVPSAITQAETLEEAYENAAEALGRGACGICGEERNGIIWSQFRSGPKRYSLSG